MNNDEKTLLSGELTLPACLADYVPPAMAASVVDALSFEVREFVRSEVRFAVGSILKANFGEDMGYAICADLYGEASQPNRELAKGKVSRAAVSKAVTRIRRGLGLPVRCPKNARPKHDGDSTSKTSPYDSYTDTINARRADKKWMATRENDLKRAKARCGAAPGKVDHST